MRRLVLGLVLLATPAGAQPTADKTQAACVQDGPASSGGYWLDATLVEEAQAWRLRLSTNVRLRGDAYGGPPAAGEGHIHLYLKNALIGPLLDDSGVLLPKLQRESYVVSLKLAASNHDESAYGICRAVRVPPAG